ncbi:MAG: CCA tRNA nucleotidyltransferase, partial [Armatimonadetes bacterium]|nr:CCA tRNA nucleotidyltransferase [Armatimonadota bacterium]
DAYHDVTRRDFTVNGLLYDPLTDRLLDFVGGQDDITARNIRAIGDPRERFEEDRLRMLRAVRLATELDFRIVTETFEAIPPLAPRVTSVSAERVRDELIRIFTGPRPVRGLRLLDESDLLAPLLPEVAAMKGVAQPPEFHPEGDVFVHTAVALDALESPSAVLAFGTLLHDVGKPPTFAVKERIRFDGHDEVGATIARDVCRRLRFSQRDTDRVVALVGEHMRFAKLPSMREGKRLQFFARPDFHDHLALHRADCLASHQDLDIWEWVRATRGALTQAELAPPRLVTGDDLVALGLRPGPAFSEILEEVREAQLEGRVHDREAGLALAAESAARWTRTAAPEDRGAQRPRQSPLPQAPED